MIYGKILIRVAMLNTLAWSISDKCNNRREVVTHVLRDYRFHFLDFNLILAG